jgi:hypothetical protein
MQRPITPIPMAWLLISLVAAGGVLAQQARTSVSALDPTWPRDSLPDTLRCHRRPRAFPPGATGRRFADWRLDPAVAAPGGYVYTTVIAGDISTRISARPGEEASYQTGSALVESPGEGLQIGDAGPASGRVISTALLPTNAPLTMCQNGLTSNAYPTLTDWFWVQDIDFGVPCPITVGRSTVEVDRPEGAFELVQLVLDLNPGISTPRHIHGGPGVQRRNCRECDAPTRRHCPGVRRRRVLGQRIPAWFTQHVTMARTWRRWLPHSYFRGETAHHCRLDCIEAAEVPCMLPGSAHQFSSAGTASLRSSNLSLVNPKASCRLVTLVGPGGVGKTRLALERRSGQARRNPPGGRMCQRLDSEAHTPGTLVSPHGVNRLPALVPLPEAVTLPFESTILNSYVPVKASKLSSRANSIWTVAVPA